MIQPKSKTISDIFFSWRSKLSVPAYQRDFNRWIDELQELISDLKLGIEKDRNLFLWNFIFDISNGKDHKIVDWQQRITTISLILISARETAKKLNETVLANKVQDAITFKDDLWDDSDIRVTVAPNIKEIYWHMSSYEWKWDFPEKLNGKQIKRQISKVKQLYKSIYNEMQSYDITTLRNFLKRLYDSYVTLIEVESEEDVFDIFERTNARWLDLNIADLLKNAIFAHDMKHEDKRNEIRVNGNGTLPKMLKYFRVSRKWYIKKDDLYRELKKYAKEIEMENLVEELLQFSKYYKAIQSDSIDEITKWLKEFWLKDITDNQYYCEEITRIFQALKFFKITQTYPIIYSVLVCYKNSGIQKWDNLMSFLKIFEKYHFMNNIICTRIWNEVEKLYADRAPILFESSDYLEHKEALTNDLRTKKAAEDEFVASFHDISYPEDIWLLHYIFDKINNQGLKWSQIVSLFSPEKKGQKRNDNVEHILSQDNKKQAETPEELIEKIDNIWNLLVFSRHSNSKFQNKPVNEKMEMLKEPEYSWSLVYLKRFIEDYEKFASEWWIEVIDKRANDLARYAYQTVWNF